jgi:hypothetical protein
MEKIKVSIGEAGYEPARFSIGDFGNFSWHFHSETERSSSYRTRVSDKIFEILLSSARISDLQEYEGCRRIKTLSRPIEIALSARRLSAMRILTESLGFCLSDHRSRHFHSRIFILSNRENRDRIQHKHASLFLYNKSALEKADEIFWIFLLLLNNLADNHVYLNINV